MVRLLILSAAATIFIGLQPLSAKGPAAEPDAKPPAAAAGKPLSDKKMRSLARTLVSPNRAPEIEPLETFRPSAKYDEGAQLDVLDAWLTLQRCGPRAFPFLFDSLKSDRYSFTADGHESYENWTVGQACQAIIDGELQPYRKYYRFKTDDGPRIPRYIYRFDLDTPEGAKKWWKTHKDKTLHELQIEVLEWLIADLPNDTEYAQVQKDLKADLTKLRVGKEPLEPFLPTEELFLRAKH